MGIVSGMCSAVMTIEHQFGLCLLGSDEIEGASGWLVHVRNPDYGQETFLGPYEDSVEAMRAADTQMELLARRGSVLSLEVTVHPMTRR